MNTRGVGISLSFLIGLVLAIFILTGVLFGSQRILEGNVDVRALVTFDHFLDFVDECTGYEVTDCICSPSFQLDVMPLASRDSNGFDILMTGLEKGVRVDLVKGKVLDKVKPVVMKSFIVPQLDGVCESFYKNNKWSRDTNNPVSLHYSREMSNWKEKEDSIFGLKTDPAVRLAESRLFLKTEHKMCPIGPMSSTYLDIWKDYPSCDDKIEDLHLFDNLADDGVLAIVHERDSEDGSFLGQAYEIKEGEEEALILTKRLSTFGPTSFHSYSQKIVRGLSESLGGFLIDLAPPVSGTQQLFKEHGFDTTALDLRDLYLSYGSLKDRGYIVSVMTDLAFIDEELDKDYIHVRYVKGNILSQRLAESLVSHLNELNGALWKGGLKFEEGQVLELYRFSYDIVLEEIDVEEDLFVNDKSLPLFVERGDVPIVLVDIMDVDDDNFMLFGHEEIIATTLSEGVSAFVKAWKSDSLVELTSGDLFEEGTS